MINLDQLILATRKQLLAMGKKPRIFHANINLPFSSVFSTELTWLAPVFPLVDIMGEDSEEGGGVGSTAEGDTGGLGSSEPSWRGDKEAVVAGNASGSSGGDKGKECMMADSGVWTWSEDKLCCNSVTLGICFVVPSLFWGSWGKGDIKYKKLVSLFSGTETSIGKQQTIFTETGRGGGCQDMLMSKRQLITIWIFTRNKDHE